MPPVTEPTLRESIEKAANKLESGLTEKEASEEVLPEGEEVETLEGKEEVEEVEEGEADLDEPSLEEAKKLYKALKDPKTANQVVGALAAQLGLLSGQPKAAETPKEEAKAKKAVKDILKSALGDEYSFLSDKLGNALDEVFSQQAEEQALKDEIALKSQTEKQTVEAFDKLAVQTKNESRKFEKQMADLSAKILPGPGMTVEEYIKVLYTQVTAGRKVAIVKSEINDKIRRNANDVTGRLHTAGGKTGNEGKFDPTKSYTLKESVALAQKQLEQSNRK